MTERGPVNIVRRLHPPLSGALNSRIAISLLSRGVEPSMRRDFISTCSPLPSFLATYM